MLAEVVTYNQKGQLTGVVNSPSNATVIDVSYAYDVMGRRVSKTVSGVTTKFVYDGLNLIMETDGSDNVIAWYVYGGLDRPLARIAADGTVHYYHQDILGSVIALTDASGNVVTRYNYSPFGETNVSHLIGQVDQPFQFTGREYDVETGMYFYRARYYSPEMRRFISEDPLRFAAGDVNFYAYVGNNPVNFVDPMGLDDSMIGRNINKGPTVPSTPIGSVADLINQVTGYFQWRAWINANNAADADIYKKIKCRTYKGQRTTIKVFFGLSPIRYIGFQYFNDPNEPGGYYEPPIKTEIWRPEGVREKPLPGQCEVMHYDCPE